MDINEQRLYLGPAATRLLSEFDSEDYTPSPLAEEYSAAVRAAAAETGGIANPSPEQPMMDDRVRNLLRCVRELREVAAPEVRDRLSLVVPASEGTADHADETILALFDVLAVADPKGERMHESSTVVH